MAVPLRCTDGRSKRRMRESASEGPTLASEASVVRKMSSLVGRAVTLHGPRSALPGPAECSRHKNGKAEDTGSMF